MKRLSCADSLLLLCVRSTLSTVCILALVYAVLPVIAPAQTLNTLFGFNVNDGDFPVTTLVEGKGGNLYGTTSGGGEHNAGTVFKMTPDGQVITLYNFCSLGPFCIDGAGPFTPLVQSAVGNLIGTTVAGGGLAYRGTVFEITRDGSLETLHSFWGGGGLRSSRAVGPKQRR